MTNKLVFIEFAGSPFIPFIPSIVAGEGLAPGIGMSIFCPGAVGGFGEAEGICIPGMFVCVGSDDAGEVCGISIPGMFVWDCGDDLGAGVCFGRGDGLAPGSIRGIVDLAGFFRVAGFFFRVVCFRRVVGLKPAFGFCLLIPGMFDMSCWAKTVIPPKRNEIANSGIHTFTRQTKCDVTIFIPPSKKGTRTISQCKIELFGEQDQMRSSAEQVSRLSKENARWLDQKHIEASAISNRCPSIENFKYCLVWTVRPRAEPSSSKKRLKGKLQKAI